MIGTRPLVESSPDMDQPKIIPGTAQSVGAHSNWARRLRWASRRGPIWSNGMGWKPSLHAGESLSNRKPATATATCFGSVVTKLLRTSNISGLPCQPTSSHLPTQTFRAMTLPPGGTP